MYQNRSRQLEQERDKLKEEMIDNQKDLGMLDQYKQAVEIYEKEMTTAKTKEHLKTLEL